MKRIFQLALLLCAACAPALDPEVASSRNALVLTPAEEAAILDLVNYPDTTVAVLEGSVGLNTNAAQHIIAQRNGADGVSPSSDDAYFSSIAALSAVPDVDDAALQALDTYALAHPAPAGEVVEGTIFRGWESQAVVWGVNHSDAATLDSLLEQRAANGLYAGRPFTSVTQMGPVPYVGPAALGQLLAHAGPWWNCMHGGTCLAGTFDGVSFDEATAVVALEIANQATFGQLTHHGVTTQPANYMIAARPFSSVAQVAATYGIGPVTMTSLRSYAQSGVWGTPDTCIPTFENAVGPHLADVLFMSESDRPFQLVSWQGAGANPPTPASVLALVGAPTGWYAEQRDVNHYWSAMESASSTADPLAAYTIRTAFEDQLTDIIYVAVHAPDGSPDAPVVQVYLVGRTWCGDVVGIKSIAIET